MKVKDFLDKLTLAVNSKTLWVKGGFGAPATDHMKERYAKRNPGKVDKIMAASPDTFFMDCSGMVKGIIWGWHADPSLTYGGAIYCSQGLDDLTTEQLIKACPDVSTDMNNIKPGELLWQEGHVGVYVGDGAAIECTGLWKDGAQLVPLSKRTGEYEWKKHGHLPWIDYTEEVQPKYQVGQIVDFSGTVYYGSANSTMPWATDPGRAVVTDVNMQATHQYNIKGQSGTNVNGWVDEKTLSVYTPAHYTEPTMTCSVKLPVLTQGTRAEAVKTLRILMNARGAKLAISDEYTTELKTAVKKLKTAAGISEKPIDLVGEKTWRNLITGK